MSSRHASDDKKMRSELRGHRLGDQLQQEIGIESSHCNLGHAMWGTGEFRPALDAMRRGHELAASRPQWRYPSTEWVRGLEYLVRQEEWLIKVASGEEAVKGSDDTLWLAELAPRTRRWPLAAKWYAAAIEEAPDLLGNSEDGLALRGARAVVQAISGAGTDSRESHAEFARLRPRALEWLTRELRNRQEDLPAPELRKTLAAWLSDPLLSPVRDEPCLSNLPEQEARAWREFWDEVRASMR